MSEKAIALELKGVSKSYGGLKALDGADLEVRAGEVMGLLGQNGSGKSTLVKSLTGVIAPDSADVARIWGQDLSFPLTRPLDHGIAVIHQELGLIDTMTVAENLGVSVGYGSGVLAPVSWQGEAEAARNLLEEFGMPISPKAMVGDLSSAERAAVAIARGMRQLNEETKEQQLFLLDEPTAYLPAEEAGRVIQLMRHVADRGASVIFISHRLAEVAEVCDRATILRDGRTVGCVELAESNPSEIMSLMLGRRFSEFYPDKEAGELGEVLVATEEVSAEVLNGLSFELRAGEILGVTGLVGQGQQELPYVLGGSVKVSSGRVVLRGEDVTDSASRERIESGIAVVPANRKRDGLWQDATAAENVSLPVLPSFYKGGWLRLKQEANRAKDLIGEFDVVPNDPTRPAFSFSGGNQQKIVLAKWLQTSPQVLVLDEPTQGVDAGAKKEILELVKQSALGGAGILICSSDHEEVANTCHRVLVLDNGRIVAELVGDDVTEQAILESCHADLGAELS